MHKKVFLPLFVVAVLGFAVSGSHAAEWGLKKGTPELKSAGPLTFGPDGILFVGDTKAAAIFAIQTDDGSAKPSDAKLNIEAVNEIVADLLKARTGDVAINDLAVNPRSGNVYLSVTKKHETEPVSALIQINGAGKLSVLSLKSVAFSKVTLPNPPEDKPTGRGRRRRNRRNESITDLVYFDGKVMVSGLTNNSAPSAVREVAFPFAAADEGTIVEIYHGAHGRLERGSVVRAFVPFNINGEPSLLAGFQCTPLVKFPVKGLSAGKTLRGTTVAELGNRNRPLDMIVYKKDGKDFLLMANSARGVMKISTENLGRKEGITERVGGGGTAGQTYDTIEELKGVVQLDRLNNESAIILVKTEGGASNLQTIALP